MSELPASQRGVVLLVVISLLAALIGGPVVLLVQVVLLGMALAWMRWSGVAMRPWYAVPPGTLAIFAALSFLRFGDLHGDGRALHDHELFHYTMGSRYFAELGHDGLYCATLRALEETEPATAAQLTLVNNLRANVLEGADVCRQRADGIAAGFSEPRWQAYVADIRVFHGRIGAAGWPSVLVDHGYNGTPLWTMVGGALVGLLGLSGGSLWLMAAIDPLLILGMLWVIRRAWDAETAALFAVVLLANPFGTWTFTGGALLRQLWLAGLVGWACASRLGWPGLAGLALAVAALDRIFPGLFVLVPLAAWWGRGERGALREVVAFGITVALLAPVASALTGHGWTDFFANIRAHEAGFYFNQISLRNLGIVDPTSPLVWGGGAWDEVSWQRERAALAAQTGPLLLGARAALAAGVVLALQAPKGRWTLVVFLPFVLLYPANYYHALLALTVLGWREQGELPRAVIGLMMASLLLYVVLPSPLQMELVHWAISAGLLALLLRELWVSGQGAGSISTRAWVAAMGAGAAVVLVGALSLPTRAGPGVDVAMADVRLIAGARAAVEPMMSWGNGWSRQDHLVALPGDGGVTLEVPFQVEVADARRLRVDLTATPAFGAVDVDVDGVALGPVGLLASQPMVRTVVRTGLDLAPGPHRLVLRSTSPLGVDRVVPLPPALEARSALDAAIGWVEAHPADAFDGGLAALADELLLWRTLATRPALAARRPEFEARIAERIDRLQGWMPQRPLKGDVAALPAIAWVAAQHGLPLPALAAWSERLERAVRGAAPGTSPGPCLWWRRLGPERDVGCGEDPDAAMVELAGWVGGGGGELGRLMAEVLAATALGQEPPTTGALADRGFWSTWCAEGLGRAVAAEDPLAVARVVVIARALGVALESGDAMALLRAHQELDGAFGASEAWKAEPRRQGAIYGALALALEL